MIASIALSKSLGGRQAFAFTLTIILSCEKLSFTTEVICLSENTIRINTKSLYRRLHIGSWGGQECLLPSCRGVSHSVVCNDFTLPRTVVHPFLCFQRCDSESNVVPVGHFRS